MAAGRKRRDRSRVVTGLVVAVLAAWGAPVAWAQPTTLAVWDVPLGTHVSQLPVRDFVDPACGTNGGPAGAAIGEFDNFARCPVEEATGLREIWFIYSDLFEYVARARRMQPSAIERQKATQVLNQPVIVSLLVDEGGFMRGYRILSDPRADPELRESAYVVANHYKARFGPEGWSCTDLPPAEGETPFGRSFIKEQCEKELNGARLTVETRLFYKTGQAFIDPRNGTVMVNEFESSARLEVQQTDPVPASLAEAAQAEPSAAADPAVRFADQREAFLARQTRDCPGCDLAKVDFRRLDLSGADLSGANLAGAIFHRAILREANLSDANLEWANFNKATLTNAKLTNAKLTRAMLFQADASGADFSGADLSQVAAGEARLVRATLDGVILNGGDLYEARLNDASLVKAALNATDLYGVAMMRADLRGASVESADIMDAQLRGSDLSGAIFRRSDLYGADLTGANLTGADFSRSRLLLAKLQDADQTGTIFTGALMPDNSRHP